jgi:signal transduction histidine kinase
MLVGRALEPVDRFGRTAQRMIDGDFTARIPLDGVETELKQAGRAINGAFERMYESLEMQRRFTADASHELRTPLATIAIETQTILARDRDAQAYRGALEVCRRAADRMRRVTERLLLLARADGGDVTLARVGVRLDLLVRRVLDDLSAIAAERRVTVAASTEPVSVEGDVDRLVEAVTSLIANAIEYNVPDGRVDLGVHRRGKRVEIRVTDTGIGIDAAHVPRIFDRFYRADPARARARGGAGLGLAVAQSIIRQHGGQITCTSEPGRGSVFVVELPVA